MVEDLKKNSVLTEKNVDNPSKIILLGFIFIFILGVFLVVIIIMTIDNFYAFMDTRTWIVLILCMVFSIFIVVIGGVGIILYFVAPDKLNKFIKWLVRISYGRRWKWGKD